MRNFASGPIAFFATLGIAMAPPATAAEPIREERTFSTTVDGKPAGTFTMISTTRDAKTTIQTKVDLKFPTLLGSYRYTLNSVEVWDDGRLTALTSTADDDGKKHKVAATANGDRIAVKADGKSRTVKGPVVTATGWLLPATGADGQATLNVLDSEDGTDTLATVERLPDGTWNRAAVQRYKLTGKDLDAEWWYDATNRLVRQAMVWDGHKVVIELSSPKK